MTVKYNSKLYSFESKVLRKIEYYLFGMARELLQIE